MKAFKLTMVGLFIGFLCLTLVPSLRASLADQATIVTFNSPIEVPGQVLQPGTYMFTLANSTSTQNIVQIFNRDRTHVYATILTIPAYRPDPPNQTLITFEERAASAPPAVHAWFYPGENYGHQFLYNKSLGLALAQDTSHAVAAATAEQTAETPQGQPSNEPQPTDTSDVSVPAAAQPDNPDNTQEQAAPNNTQQQNDQSDQPAQRTNTPGSDASMPQTASPMPGLILMGLLSLGAGVGLRAMAKQRS